MPTVDTAWPGIKLQYEGSSNPYFEVIAKEALSLIAAKPVGAQLLSGIGQTAPQVNDGLPAGCNVLIMPTTERKFYDQSVRQFATDARHMVPSGLSGSCNAALSPVAGGKTNAGSACKLYFNNTIRVTSRGEATYPFIALAHELIHSLHCLTGTRMDGKAEELKTVGLDPYSGEAITENNIRAEHGIALRTQYY
jgi:hypothetical protein